MRRGAEAVDQHRHAACSRQFELGEQVLQHFIGQRVGALHGAAPDTRFAMDAHAELDLAVADGEAGLARLGHHAGRDGLATAMTNTSVTRQPEGIALYTTRLNDGSLFFVVGVAPANEFGAYQRIFNRSVQSLELNDGYRNSRF